MAMHANLFLSMMTMNIAMKQLCDDLQRLNRGSFWILEERGWFKTCTYRGRTEALCIPGRRKCRSLNAG